MIEDIEDPEGCSTCGAIAGVCAEYPACPGYVEGLEKKLDDIANIPAEVVEAAQNLQRAGGDAQLLAQFVLELGVKT